LTVWRSHTRLSGVALWASSAKYTLLDIFNVTSTTSSASHVPVPPLRTCVHTAVQTRCNQHFTFSRLGWVGLGTDDG